MERLARLAHRIVWVNPRVAASGFHPRAGGMAAALPHCDALVSGHSLRALEEVATAISAPRGRARACDELEARPGPATEPEETVGQRHAGPGQFGRDAERLRAEQRAHHARMGTRWPLR